MFRMQTVESTRTERTAPEYVGQAMLELVSRTSAHVGEAYFKALAAGLADVVSCGAAFVVERPRRRESALRPLSVMGWGESQGVEEHAISGSACEVAMSGVACVQQVDARRTFPLDPVLSRVDASSVVIVAVRAAGGAVNGFVGVAHHAPLDDVFTTEALLRLVSPRVGAEIERMHIAEALREQSELTQAFMERAEDMILRTRPGESPVIEYVNPAFERFTGYSREELYGDPRLLLRIAHPDDRPHFARMLVDGDVSQPRVWRWIRSDGSILWTEGRRTHIYDESGNLIAIESIARDITERQQAEERAAVAEELHRVLLAAMPDTVIRVARTGSITKVVNTSATPSPFVREPVDGATLTDILPAAAVPDVMHSLGLCLVSQQIETLEFELDGEEANTTFEARIVPVDSEQGVIFFRNIMANVVLHRAAARERSKEELEGKAERRILRANPYNLTFREFTVLELVARGLTDKQIALDLSISLNTVGKHVSNILGKMHVGSRTEASVHAVQQHLLD